MDSKEYFLRNDKSRYDYSYKTGFDHAVKYIYDSKRKKILGFTQKQFLVFLGVMFGLIVVLVGFSSAMFFIFTEFVINEDNPFRLGGQSIINKSPALSFKPVTDFYTTLIRYQNSDPATYMTYVQSLRTFVDLYEDKNMISQDAYASCTKDKKSPNKVESPCRFDPILLGMCRKQYNFGYDRGTPCIVLKLNQVYGWVPDVKNASVTKNILVNCAMRNEEGREMFAGLSYFPNMTIKGQTYGYFNHLFYPYVVQYGYRQPLVGVMFKTPKRNVVLMLQCKVLNLNNNPDPVTFEIMID